MKKSLLFFATLISFIGNSQTSPGFTVTNTNGSYAITCATPTLNFTANSINNLTYVWTGPSSSQTGSNVNISIPGNYTVVGTDTANTSTNSIFTVVMNTFVPNSSISPTFASVSCSISSAVTFTGTTNTPNCTQKFLSPFGGTVYAQNPTSFYTPNGPGIYTLVTLDNTNGCSSIKNFTITSTSGLPTYSIVSPQNYTLGCANHSFVVVMIINASATNSLQIPTGGAVSYAMMSPATSSSTPPSFSNFSSYTLTTPGIYTAIVRDNVSFCETRTPFTVLQNTTTPNLSVMVPTQVLDCNTTQVTLNGSSNTPNVSYQWSFAGTPGIVLSDSINVQTNLIAPSSTVINMYTLSITDNSSACKSMSVIPMYQNTFKPNAAISSGGNFTITCLTPTIALTNISATGIPPSTGFPGNMPVIGLLWTGPSPLLPAANSSTYVASVSGTYTMIAKDLNNGCSKIATISIVGDCNQVGIEKNAALNSNFSVFPNPTNGLFTVLSNDLKENSKIEIYNTLGVLIRTETVNSEKTNIHLEDVSRGIYIIQVFENDKIIYSSKIIKE